MLNMSMQGEALLSYKEARAYLDSLQFHKIKLGLQPMRDFHESLGNPESALKIVHVAGTNGKGSVCSALVSVMAKANYRVGIYTSPHLSSARERFRINDDYISQDDFARLTTFIQKILAGRPITYFEFTTSLALLWFYEQGVDLVVLETGLGGRLDATNIISNPLVTIITSISMDHEAYLGTTIEEVASEKAGIIKPGVPVVATSRDSRVVAVLKTFAQKQNAPLYLRGTDFDESWQGGSTWSYRANATLGEWSIDQLENAKPGATAAENGAAVVASVYLLKEYGFCVSQSALRSGLAEVSWPGRQELIEQEGKRFLLDGAHNPAGVQSLVEVLQSYSYNRLFAIWGAMADKDIASGLRGIVSCCDQLLLAAVESERAAEPAVMLGLLDEDQSSKAMICQSSTEALTRAKEMAGTDDLILVAGSLFLVGELRPQLVGGLV